MNLVTAMNRASAASSLRLTLPSLVLVVFACSSILAADPTPIPTIPRQKPPTIDGKREGAEWKGARVEKLADGTAIHLMHDGKSLHVAMETRSPAIGTIFFQLGEKVHVLHASARLGRAIYARDGERWKLERAFEYAAPSDEFWKKEHWRASTIGSGASWMEFSISLEELLGVPGKDEDESGKSKKKPAGEEESEAERDRRAKEDADRKAKRGPKPAAASTLPPFAIVPWSPGGAVASHPGGLQDDVTHRQLLMGHSPPTLRFDPKRWGRARLKR